MPPTQGLWSLILLSSPTSLQNELHSLGSRMWLFAATLRKLWMLSLMNQTAAIPEAVSLTITLSHKTVPRAAGNQMGTKMDVSRSLSVELFPAYHLLSMVEGTKAIGFPLASSWEEKL